MTMNLRETLLAALARLPGTREFQLHVLVTSARKDSSLYRYATPRPRTFVQDILVLLSEGTEGAGKFVVGIEAHVYTVVETSSGILYIAKVDTTGQGTGPSATYTLVRELMGYYADPATRPVGVERLWIHLFARAQGQYLFANSGEYEGKRPLSDVRLCGWWQRVFGDVEGIVRGRGAKTELYYALAGYGEAEAVQLLSASGPAANWTYGHPYSETAIGLPWPGEHLGHVVPWFEDDPKARFLDELAGQRRKRKRDTSELYSVGPDEFWERMSFRQECVSGAVTGFFVLGVAGEVAVAAETAGGVPGQVQQRILDVLTTKVEFSSVERALRGTAIVESAIRGLCEDVSGRVRVTNDAQGTTGTQDGTTRVLSARRKQ